MMIDPDLRVFQSFLSSVYRSCNRPNPEGIAHDLVVKFRYEDQWPECVSEIVKACTACSAWGEHWQHRAQEIMELLEAYLERMEPKDDDNGEVCIEYKPEVEWEATEATGIREGTLARQQLEAAFAQGIDMREFMSLFPPSRPSPYEE